MSPSKSQLKTRKKTRDQSIEVLACVRCFIFAFFVLFSFRIFVIQIVISLFPARGRYGRAEVLAMRRRRRPRRPGRPGRQSRSRSPASPHRLSDFSASSSSILSSSASQLFAIDMLGMADSRDGLLHPAGPAEARRLPGPPTVQSAWLSSVPHKLHHRYLVPGRHALELARELAIANPLPGA